MNRASFGNCAKNPLLQQFVDPRSGRMKLKGFEFKLVVVSFASLNKLEEFLGILVFD
jgi:hypothetical protein